MHIAKFMLENFLSSNACCNIVSIEQKFGWCWVVVGADTVAIGLKSLVVRLNKLGGR